MEITQLLIQTRFIYKEGHLYYRVRLNNGTDINKPAGTAKSDGYREIMIYGKSYGAHRLVWIYHNNLIPSGMVIDHIDGDPGNNKIENLRTVSTRINQNNQIKHRNGKLPGCYFHKASKKWVAKYKYEGKTYWIGAFPTELCAHRAYLNAISNL